MPELARAPQVVASHPDVAECCVVGASDALKGQLPLGLIVLRKSATSEPKDVEAQVGPTPKSLREGGRPPRTHCSSATFEPRSQLELA